MAAHRRHHLIEIDWPEFGEPQTPPRIPKEEYSARLAATRSAMAAGGLNHLVVYADREHFANLAWLTGFDPRFEEAVMIVGLAGKPLILVGNECRGYLQVSGLYALGELRMECYQPLSLLDQPRADSRRLSEILAGEGIGASSKVGCAGWKYFSGIELADPAHALEIPSYLADALRTLAGCENVTNANAMFMHSGAGLRARCSASEIAYFEWTGARASEGIGAMIRGAREGMVDFDVARLAGYSGLPMSFHMGLLAGDNPVRSMAGPAGARVIRGMPIKFSLGYWGSNCCRAGWAADSERDLPAPARDYIDSFAGPYFRAMNEWYSLMRIGTPGGRIADMIFERLPLDRFGVYLNPGHLIHLDEWLSSPIYAGSQIPLASGMAMQADVIPTSSTYYSTRMEDGLALADAALQAELAARYPDCLARCQARRKFMTDVLGLDVSNEVLPLSNIPAIVPPYFLNHRLVFAMK